MYFQLILTVDFMAFYFTKTYSTLMVTKKLQHLGPPSMALPLDPAGGLAPPRLHAMSPSQSWRQIDTYDSGYGL